MTRVDFYILPEPGTPASGAVMTACRLCDKASAAGQRVFAYAPEDELARALDVALWSFRQGSFLAHERNAEALAEPLPMILIGATEPPEAFHQIMINLDLKVPPFFSRFERVLEIVHGDDAQRARSRERYKFYKDRGYELATNKL